MKIIADLESQLRSGLRKFQVPGASLGIYRSGRLQTCAGGVINLNTGVKATTDTVFQIGSITKPVTTTLVMQLIEEGAVELDAPVVEYLPEFRVARLDISRKVTIRHFLSHTSGIDGDLFVDTGRGDEATARFIDRCTQVPSLFEPGTQMSYCNLGFAVLGRIIELQRNKSYDQALHDHLFKPLNMQHALSRPEDTLKYRTAIGHLPNTKKPGTWRVTPAPYLSFGQKAAGATPAMSVGDLLTFARMHLDRGKGADGTRILKSSSVSAMQRRQIRLPKHMRNGIHAWGLGWCLMNWQGQKLYGHDGATMGQFAFLRVLPEDNIAVALLTNGGDAQGLYRHLYDSIFGKLARVSDPQLPAPLTNQPDPGRYIGHYENILNRIEIGQHQGRATIQSVHKDSGVPAFPERTPITFVDQHTARPDTGQDVFDRQPIHFSDYDPTGKATFLKTGFRRYPRTGA